MFRKPTMCDINPLDFSSVKQSISDFKFANVWSKRNTKDTLVMLKTLEVEYDILEQYVFLENTTELKDKLIRLGFAPLHALGSEPPAFTKYTTTLYNKEYNIAFNLYDPRYRTAIKNSIAITKLSNTLLPIHVMVASIQVLLDTPKKQILMESNETV